MRAEDIDSILAMIEKMRDMIEKRRLAASADDLDRMSADLDRMSADLATLVMMAAEPEITEPPPRIVQQDGKTYIFRGIDTAPAAGIRS